MSYASTDDDLLALVACAAHLGVDPHDLLTVLVSESDFNPHAWNKPPSGDPDRGAFGINQLVRFPGSDILTGVGWTGTGAEYLALTAAQQMRYVERFFAPYKGRLDGGAGAMYLANFLPAFLDRRHEPPYVLASSTFRPAFYTPNRFAFDPEGKGWINVGDLQRRADRVKASPRYAELAGRLEALRRVDEADAAAGLRAAAVSYGFAGNYVDDTTTTPVVDGDEKG